MVRLGKRLQCIFDLVDPGGVVADIGCDHALLCIALVEQGIAKKAYACDVAEGPLTRAISAIQTAQLQEQITTVLTDGIAELPSDVDTFIIAGMGFETIQKILLEGRAHWKESCTFLLASHTDVDELRRFLSQHQFVIDQERIVFERHYYQIIKAHHEDDAPALTEDEILFGVHMRKEALYRMYWQKEMQKYAAILEKMPTTHERYGWTNALYERIAAMLLQFDESQDR